MEGLSASASQEGTDFVQYQLQAHQKEATNRGKLAGLGNANQA